MEYSGKHLASEEFSSENLRSYSRDLSDYSLSSKPVKESPSESFAYERTLKILEEENKQLRQQLSIAGAKLEILKNEKDMHIQSHANDRAVWESEKCRLLSELTQVRSECKTEYEHALQLVSEVKDSVASFRLRVAYEEPGDSMTLKLSEHEQKIRVSPS